MADTQEVRRQNLRRLISDHNGMNKLAAKLGLLKGAYLSQLLSTPPVRTISEKTVRRWEKILGLPEGWMDGQPRAHSGVAPVASTTAVDTTLLERVMSVVFEELKKAGVSLNSARLAGLMAMQYQDAFALGRVDQDRIRRIVQLLKK